MKTPALALALVLASPLAAQLGRPAPNQTFGGSATLDVQAVLSAATGAVVDGIVGAARDANGHYWIAARRAPRLPLTNQHMLYELDSNAQFVAGYPQPVETQNSAWGFRDLAFDGQRYLYGGFEGDRVHAFDTVARVFAPAQDFVVPSGLTFSTMRALAYDPGGAAGQGSLWVASFTSEHVEFDRAGNVLNTIPNLQPGTFGAAFDPVRGSIWWFGQSGSGRPDTGVVATEMDVASATATGQRVLGDLSLTSPLLPGGFAGGAEFYQNTSGQPRLLLLAQAGADTIVEIDGRFEYGQSAGGSVSFTGGACYAGNADFEVTLENSTATGGILILGSSSSDIDLGLFGYAPGNRLLVDLNQTHFPVGPLPVALGTSSFSLPIPASSQIVGLDLYMQWLELSVSGLTTSSAGSIQILP